MKKITVSVILFSTMILTVMVGFQNCGSSKNNSKRTPLKSRLTKQLANKSLVTSKSVKEFPNIDVQEKTGYIKVENGVKSLSTTARLKPDTNCFYVINNIPDIATAEELASCVVEVINEGTSVISLSYLQYIFEVGLSFERPQQGEVSEVTVGGTKEISVQSREAYGSPLPIHIVRETEEFDVPVSVNYPEKNNLTGPVISAYTPSVAGSNPKLTISSSNVVSHPLLGEPVEVIYYAYCDDNLDVANSGLVGFDNGEVELKFNTSVIGNCIQTITIFSDVIYAIDSNETGEVLFAGNTFPDTGNPVPIRSETIRIGQPTIAHPCPTNLPLTSTQYLFQAYTGWCADGGASMRIELDLVNYTEQEISNLRLCFRSPNSPAIVRCPPLSELGFIDSTNSNSPPNTKTYYLETYPKNLVSAEGTIDMTLAFLGSQDAPNTRASFEAIDEYFDVSLTNSSGQPFSSNLTNGITPDDTISFRLAGKNSNDNFSFCKEVLDGTTECTNSAYTSSSTLGPLFTCGNDTTSGARLCTYIGASLGRLQFDAGKTYQVNIKNNSTRFPSIITYTFEVSQSGQSQSPPTLSCTPLTVDCGQTLNCTAHSTDTTELQGCNRMATPNCRTRLTQDPNFPANSPFQWVRTPGSNPEYTFSFLNDSTTHNTVDDAVNAIYVKDSRGQVSPDVGITLKGCAPRP